MNLSSIEEDKKYLEIALKPMKNSGRTSVVGKVIDEEIYLLDYIKPWQKFKFLLNL